MFWNETKRQWERHPDCTCDHDPCYCPLLRTLDKDGKPIPHTVIDGLRKRILKVEND